MAQPDQERKDSQNKRKREQRARDKEKENPPKTYPYPMMKGTSEAVERLKSKYEFNSTAELLTFIIHNVDSMGDCDTVTKEQFFNIPKPARLD